MKRLLSVALALVAMMNAPVLAQSLEGKLTEQFLTEKQEPGVYRMRGYAIKETENGNSAWRAYVKLIGGSLFSGWVRCDMSALRKLLEIQPQIKQAEEASRSNKADVFEWRIRLSPELDFLYRRDLTDKGKITYFLVGSGVPAEADTGEVGVPFAKHEFEGFLKIAADIVAVADQGGR